MNVLSEIQKIWDAIPKSENIANHSFNLTVQKQLLQIFHVGSYFCYIVNVRHSLIEQMSDEVETVLGYPREQLSLPFMLDIMHADDVPFFVNFEGIVERFFANKSGDELFKYKVQYDFRLLKADGTYARVLHQFMIIQHDADDVRTFALDTDITHLKTHGEPQLSFIGLNGAPSYHNVKEGVHLTSKKTVFTTREADIIRALSSGLNSQEIAQRFNISKHTVDVHRKNILKKSASKSTYELLNKAFVNGWV